MAQRKDDKTIWAHSVFYEDAKGGERVLATQVNRHGVTLHNVVVASRCPARVYTAPNRELLFEDEPIEIGEAIPFGWLVGLEIGERLKQGNFGASLEFEIGSRMG